MNFTERNGFLDRLEGYIVAYGNVA